MIDIYFSIGIIRGVIWIYNSERNLTEDLASVIASIFTFITCVLIWPLMVIYDIYSNLTLNYGKRKR